MTLLVVTGVGLVLSQVATMERRLGRNEAHRLQALAAAESGLALVVAGILDGEPAGALEMTYGMVQTVRADRVAVVEVDAPEIVSVSACSLCDPDSSAPLSKVTYRVGSAGEVRAFAANAPEGEGRRLARVSVEARVTFLPWLADGGEVSSPTEGGEVCEGDAGLRARLALEQELAPPGCRPSSLSVLTSARDPLTGVSCAVSMSVCVLTTGWRER